MPTASKTISQVFEEFLTDQEARLSPSTFSKYEPRGAGLAGGIRGCPRTRRLPR